MNLHAEDQLDLGCDQYLDKSKDLKSFAKFYHQKKIAKDEFETTFMFMCVYQKNGRRLFNHQFRVRASVQIISKSKQSAEDCLKILHYFPTETTMTKGCQNCKLC